jgi:hypothetical protein
VALLIGMLVWFGLRPGIEIAVGGLAQTLIRAFEYPRVTRLVVDDHLAQVRRSDFRSDSRIPAIPLNDITFNTIVFLALSLALPRPLSRRRIEALLMGGCVLYVTQALNLVFHVKTLYALGLGAWSQQQYTDVARDVFGFLRYFTDLPGRFSFPFLIWLAFNWDAVMEMLGGRVSGRGTAIRRSKNDTKR